MESEELDFAAQHALVYVAVYFLVESSDVLQRSSASGAKSPPELLLLPTLSNLEAICHIRVVMYFFFPLFPVPSCPFPHLFLRLARSDDF